MAGRCLEEGRALVIAANKSDLLMTKGMVPEKYEQVHDEIFLLLLACLRVYVETVLFVPNRHLH